MDSTGKVGTRVGLAIGLAIDIKDQAAGKLAKGRGSWVLIRDYQARIRHTIEVAVVFVSKFIELEELISASFDALRSSNFTSIVAFAEGYSN